MMSGVGSGGKGAPRNERDRQGKRCWGKQSVGQMVAILGGGGGGGLGHQKSPGGEHGDGDRRVCHPLTEPVGRSPQAECVTRTISIRSVESDGGPLSVDRLFDAKYTPCLFWK